MEDKTIQMINDEINSIKRRIDAISDDLKSEDSRTANGAIRLFEISNGQIAVLNKLLANSGSQENDGLYAFEMIVRKKP